MLVASHPADEGGKNCTHQPDLPADGVGVSLLSLRAIYLASFFASNSCAEARSGSLKKRCGSMMANNSFR